MTRPARTMTALRRGDRVVLLARDGTRTRQVGLIRDTRPVPSPFGGRPELWARVAWENGAGGWMAVGRSLEVIGHQDDQLGFLR